MTRYTNLGRKRTYVAAGFNYRNTTDVGADPEPSPSALPDQTSVLAIQPDDGEPTDVIPACNEEQSKSTTSTRSTSKTKRNQKVKDDAKRAAATERRRLKRIAERHSNKICYACREVGHAAQVCPKIKQDGAKDGMNRNTMGICYRCGSKRHKLSQCKKPIDQAKPLPFASCFVCNGKGHLASACPLNKEKGIYPNGGECKLCGEKTHLARDCPLRKTEGNSTSTLIDVGREAGADEDDFHTFRRKTREVDLEVQGEERVRKMTKVRAGKFSGVVKAFGPLPQAKIKKVVNF